MPHRFRAVALDYDGTITVTGRPDPGLLAALGQLRDERIRLVLVTGRIPWELLELFPQVEETFDLIVWENGAAIWSAGTTRLVAEPVPFELEEALVARGARVRRGQVILATTVQWAHAALEEVGRLGLEVQLVRNRGELMIVPAGVSKGTGLFEALGDLGVSRHSTLAVGDGENDHSLLAACELGVAVSNAVPSLKARADLVLGEPGSAGLAAFLTGPIVFGTAPAPVRRWQATLGSLEDGSPARLPGSGVNLLVCGGTRSGKSHMAGLVAERLVALGYSVCILDPEGDHAPLGTLRGILSVGGAEPLPPPDQLARFVEHRFGSVAADLSLLDPDEKRAWGRAALEELSKLTLDTGLPHWIVLDEAQLFLGAEGEPAPLDPARKGLCLVTWTPGVLDPRYRDGADVLVSLGDGGDWGEAGPLPWAGPLGEPLPAGQGALWSRAAPGEARRFLVGRRARPHARHLHKYVSTLLPAAQHFFFRAGGEPTGRSAGNVEEFHREIRRADGRVVRHHALSGDFSRWVGEVLRDDVLAATLRRLERGLRHRASAGEIEALRADVLLAVKERYQG